MAMLQVMSYGETRGDGASPWGHTLQGHPGTPWGQRQPPDHPPCILGGTVPAPRVTLHRDTWVPHGTHGYSMGTMPAPGVTAPLGMITALGVRPHRDAPGHVLWGDTWGWVTAPGVTLHRDTQVPHGTRGYPMGTMAAPGVTAPLGTMTALGVRPHRDALGHVLWGDTWGWCQPWGHALQGHPGTPWGQRQPPDHSPCILVGTVPAPLGHVPLGTPAYPMGTMGSHSIGTPW